MTASLAAGVDKTALVVDVDSTARQTLVWGLANDGFRVFVSSTSEEALRLAKSVSPALCVLELKLEDGSAFELLPALRAELPDARIVILTSYGAVASAVRAVRLGADNYLCRPASAAEVLRDPGSDPRDLEFTPTDSLTLDLAIWEYIHHTLEVSGSISEAARRLGVFRQSLKRMISKYRPAGAAASASKLSSSDRGLRSKSSRVERSRATSAWPTPEERG